MKLCERCNRPLRSQKSIDVGMGPVCKKKQEEEDVEFEKIQIKIDEVLDDEL
ncbi:DUF6011 domain-containing protein [Bacillus badius]|uniref:Uncharacterized protein n=1 Tax=Bacillus badius TaxID=1455 RepID=A0ABR5AZ89_BACBA|nr:DUF6011 domain-containing protein [Bacillus badius]KIL79563.1 hypothetical protein SD77_2017 [Bacillus badius]MED4716257.1 DUF6011 domain-containing protein [Bacillus badius]